MEAATELVKVKLIDGTEKEVIIRKYVGFRQKQKILNDLMSGMTLNTKNKDGGQDIEGAKVIKILETIAEIIWVDKNISVDDVEGDSLYTIISERFGSFLGKFGVTVENGDNPDSKSGKDE